MCVCVCVCTLENISMVCTRMAQSYFSCGDPGKAACAPTRFHITTSSFLTYRHLRVIAPAPVQHGRRRRRRVHGKELVHSIPTAVVSHAGLSTPSLNSCSNSTCRWTRATGATGRPRPGRPTEVGLRRHCCQEAEEAATRRPSQVLPGSSHSSTSSPLFGPRVATSWTGRPWHSSTRSSGNSSSSYCSSPRPRKPRMGAAEGGGRATRSTPT